MNTSKLFHLREQCAACGGKDLVIFLRLGEHPLPDRFLEKTQLDEEELKFPLEVAVCSQCNLVQLAGVVDSRLLFEDNYAYFSSASPQAVIHFRNYAHEVMKRFPEKAKQFTVEIASNDGVLLRPLKELGARVLGVEPAKNVAVVAQSTGIETVVEFFNETLGYELAKKRGKAGIISANNVVAHVDDLVDFIKGVKALVDNEGVFIFEAHYLPNLLFKNQFDNIYHEHRFYFALRPLVSLFERLGMKIFDVQLVDTQGGSLRVFSSLANASYPISSIVPRMLDEEVSLKLNDVNTYFTLKDNVERTKKKLLEILTDFKTQGKRIVGYGAPAKGNTLLNYCRIGTDFVDYLIDKTLFKHGKFTPGMHIPVFPPEKILEDGPPDCYLLLVWNYAAGMLRQEEEFRKHGGKFIIPIPTPVVV